MENVLEKVEKLIASAKIGIISSVDEDGFPNIKAMLAPRKREGLHTFWFSTNTSSRRVEQYRKNPKASIYFYKKGLFVWQGVMLIGTMEVMEDAESKESIWEKGDTVYYEQGVTDPDYCVLKFTAAKGQLYRNLEIANFTLD